MDWCYTGIGSRIAPISTLNTFESFGSALASEGYTLRSGGAEGSDSAFEQGCDKVNGPKEIFLPWEGYNNNSSPLYSIPTEAFKIAADIYGARWTRLRDPVKKLMARNIQQITGMNLDSPSLFVVCYTPDGCSCAVDRTVQTGGTGQAIAYASTLGIPIFNFEHETAQEELLEFIAGIK